MHSNILYRAFLLVVMAAAIGYSGLTTYRYHHYSRLIRQTSPLTLKWTVLELAEDEFVLEASYVFEANGTQWTGRTSWPQKIYRHAWAAEEDRQYFEKKYSKIWFDPLNPNDSSMQKKFPTKELVYSFLLWGLFIYFLGLGWYITKFK